MFRTVIIGSADGSEQRNAVGGMHARRVFNINSPVLHDTYATAAYNFYVARVGSYQSFRYVDQFDYLAVAQPVIAVSGGFQLCRAYYHVGSSGTYINYRPITKPVSDNSLGTSFSISTGGSVNFTNGFVTGGSEGTWTGNFEIEARIDNDSTIVIDNGGHQRHLNLRIIEVTDTVPPVIPWSVSTEFLGNTVSGSFGNTPIEIGMSTDFRQRTHIVAPTAAAEDRFKDWTSAQRAVVTGKWMFSTYANMQLFLDSFMVARGRKSRLEHPQLGVMRFGSDALTFRRVSFSTYEADLSVLRYI